MIMLADVFFSFISFRFLYSYFEAMFRSFMPVNNTVTVSYIILFSIFNILSTTLSQND